MADSLYPDTPITHPDQDLYGYDPFVQSLASSIAAMAPPEGLVIALHGQWGAGKTSAINLLLHHLRSNEDARNIEIVAFRPWRIRGEDALTAAFFTEIQAALGKLENKRVQKILRKIAVHMGHLADTAGSFTLWLTQIPWLGTFVTSFFQRVGQISKESLEAKFSEISKLLSLEQKRFLVVIDDIDWLPPDEVLHVFRLVKSIGNLPNLIYLLVFDRLLAESLVSNEYPSEGPEYLEKIIQVAFDLPLPNRVDIQNAAIFEISSICGTYSEDERARFGNIFHDVAVPYLSTPRDVARLGNSLRVTWPPISGEVDLADYVAIETLRLFEPTIYRRIRENKDKLCGIGARRERPANENDVYDNIFLQGFEIEDRDRIRTALMRLFPRLNGVWGNLFFDHSHQADWRRARYICSEENFDSYFRFALSDETLSVREIEDFIANIHDHDSSVAFIREKLRHVRRNGQSYIPILIEEITIRAEVIRYDDVIPLLSVFFELHDELNVPGDNVRAFLDHANTSLRIHWLTNALVKERFDQKARSNILSDAIRNASLGWKVDLASRCSRDHHVSESGRQEQVPPEERLVDSQTAVSIRELAVSAIRGASEDGTLIQNPDIQSILYRWGEFASDDEVKEWTAKELKKPKSVIRLAAAFTGESLTMGMGIFGLSDRLATPSPTVQLDAMRHIMDVDAFINRVKRILDDQEFDEDESQPLKRFLRAVETYSSGPAEQ